MTIGEVADLLEMSTSQIRFYEKEGLVKPHHISDNGYRLYDFKQVDTLEFVKLLKDLNMSLSEIDKTLKDQTEYDYKGMLEISLNALSDEIETLKKKYRQMNRKLQQYLEYRDDEYKIVELSERKVYILDDIQHHEMEIKKYYDFIKSNHLDHLDYNQVLYTIILENDGRMLCTYDKTRQFMHDKLETYELPKGRFLSYKTKVKRGADVADCFSVIFDIAEKENLRLIGEKIVIQDLDTLLYSMEEKHVMFRMRIEE